MNTNQATIFFEECAATENHSASRREALRQKIKNENINQTSFLANDYFNHFNEVVILIDMLPTMPDCLEDALAWRPRSYAEHFKASNLSYHKLAIEAYQYTPSNYRKPFHQIINRMNDVICAGLKDVKTAVETGDPDIITTTTTRLSSIMRKLLKLAASIINGHACDIKSEHLDQIIAAAAPCMHAPSE